MTATELQRITLRLANSLHVRYWLHYNHPRRDPWLMAVSLHDPCVDRARALPDEQAPREFADLGFTRDGRYPGVWTIGRTDDDGKPFDSEI